MKKIISIIIVGMFMLMGFTVVSADGTKNERNIDINEQDDYGRLEVYVYDAKKIYPFNVIHDAGVIATNEDGSIEEVLGFYADIDGYFGYLPVGNYTVSVNKSGYKKPSSKEVVIYKDMTSELTFNLIKKQKSVKCTNALFLNFFENFLLLSAIFQFLLNFYK